SSNEGELARSITTCAPARASLSPSPVMVLTPVFGAAARTSWPPWRRMGMVFEPIRPVPPITTIFIANLLVRSLQAGVCGGCVASCGQRGWSTTRETENACFPQQHPVGEDQAFKPRSPESWRSASATPQVHTAETYHVQNRVASRVYGAHSFSRALLQATG